MKWRSHRAIARAVFKALGLPGDAVEAGLRGVVDPDLNKDYVLRWGRRIYIAPANHHGAYGLAIKHVWKARLLYLRGDLRGAAFALGRAMHYIHDTYTGKGFLGLFHDRVEERIAELEVPRDALEAGFRDAASDPFAVEKAIKSFGYSNKPEVALWRAIYMSAFIAKAVFTAGDLETAARRLAAFRQRRDRATAVAIAAWSAGLALVQMFNTALALAPALAATTLALWYHDKTSKIKKWYGV